MLGPVMLLVVGVFVVLAARFERRAAARCALAQMIVSFEVDVSGLIEGLARVREALEAFGRVEGERLRVGLDVVGRGAHATAVVLMERPDGYVEIVDVLRSDS